MSKQTVAELQAALAEAKAAELEAQAAEVAKAEAAASKVREAAELQGEIANELSALEHAAARLNARKRHVDELTGRLKELQS